MKFNSLRRTVIAVSGLMAIFSPPLAAAEEKASVVVPTAPDLRAIVSSLEDDFLARLESTANRERIFADYEAALKKLIAQNPGRPEPYFGMIELWEKCGNDRALQLVDEFLRQPDLPEKVRAFCVQVRAVLQMAGTQIAVDLQTLDGKKIDWSRYRGKVVLVDFWATWCGPCVQELPKVKGYYEELHAQGLEILGVSFDDDRAKLESFLRTRQLPWTQVHAIGAQRETIGKALGVTRNYLPTVFLIGRDGRIRYSFNSRFELKNKIISLLRETPPGLAAE